MAGRNGPYSAPWHDGPLAYPDGRPRRPAPGRRLWHTAGFPLSRFAPKGSFSMASEFVVAPPAKREK